MPDNVGRSFLLRVFILECARRECSSKGCVSFLLLVCCGFVLLLLPVFVAAAAGDGKLGGIGEWLLTTYYYLLLLLLLHLPTITYLLDTKNYGKATIMIGASAGGLLFGGNLVMGEIS